MKIRILKERKDFLYKSDVYPQTSLNLASKQQMLSAEHNTRVLMNDAVLFERSFSLDKNLNQWSKFESGDEKELDELLSRQLSRDRDLWIVEIESREGDPFLDDI